MGILMSINMTQEFKFETDSLESFEMMLKTIVDICFTNETSEYTKRNISNSPPFCWDDGATYSQEKQADGITRMTRSKPTRVWVATLSDYASDIDKDEENPSDIFETNEEMVESVMERLITFDKNKLNEECGDGYLSCFNHFDGSIGTGYRVHWEPSGGWNKLYVSIVHAYYGK
jgi:hypothetical protein